MDMQCEQCGNYLPIAVCEPWMIQASHPDIEQEEIILPGEVVSPIDPPPGDVFMTRTPLPVDPDHQWAKERPPLVEIEPGHWVVKTPWSLVSELESLET